MNIGLEKVSFSYGNTPVCTDFSLALPSSGVVCLFGPSGCGKTTVLRLLAGLEEPAGGMVYRPRAVSTVFQEDRLFPWYTVMQNVCLSGCGESAAEELLEKLDLADLADRLPEALSGGQRRRVALARALAAPGDLLLLDEPFNGLDEAVWRRIVPLVIAVSATRPVVLVTHTLQQAEALEARIVSLSAVPLTGQV